METISKTATALARVTTGICPNEEKVLSMAKVMPKAAEMDLAMATEKVLSTAAPITPVVAAVPTEAGSVEDLVTDEECDDTYGEGRGEGAGIANTGMGSGIGYGFGAYEADGDGEGWGDGDTRDS
jgi:hypothetical protein